MKQDDNWTGVDWPCFAEYSAGVDDILECQQYVNPRRIWDCKHLLNNETWLSCPCGGASELCPKCLLTDEFEEDEPDNLASHPHWDRNCVPWKHKWEIEQYPHPLTKLGGGRKRTCAKCGREQVWACLRQYSQWVNIGSRKARAERILLK